MRAEITVNDRVRVLVVSACRFRMVYFFGEANSVSCGLVNGRFNLSRDRLAVQPGAVGDYVQRLERP